jgi:hypothetical protein
VSALAAGSVCLDLTHMNKVLQVGWVGVGGGMGRGMGGDRGDGGDGGGSVCLNLTHMNKVLQVGARRGGMGGDGGGCAGWQGSAGPMQLTRAASNRDVVPEQQAAARPDAIHGGGRAAPPGPRPHRSTPPTWTAACRRA